VRALRLDLDFVAVEGPKAHALQRQLARQVRRTFSGFGRRARAGTTDAEARAVDCRKASSSLRVMADKPRTLLAQRSPERSNMRG
jgi:hypothetical protein